MYKDIIIAGIFMIVVLLVIIALWPSGDKAHVRERTKIYKKKQ